MIPVRPQIDLSAVRTIRTYAPNGVADSAPLNALMRESGVREVRMLAGTAILNDTGSGTGVLVPSNIVWIWHPTSTLLSTVPANVLNYPIGVATYTAAPGETPTTLQANTVAGSPVIHTVGPISAGVAITFGNTITNRVVVRTVRSVSGSGPYILTLNKPVPFMISAGESVTPGVFTSNIEIHGQGGLLSGDGNNGFELNKVQGGLVEGVRVAGSFDTIILSWDLGGNDVEFRNCDVDGRGLSKILLSVESCSEFLVKDCKLHHSGQTDTEAVWITDSDGALINNHVFANNSQGIQVTGDLGVMIQGGKIEGHTTQAGILLNGATATSITGVTFSDNAYGVRCLTSAERVSISDCTFIRCTSAGIYQDAGELSVSNIRTTACLFGIESEGGHLEIRNWRSESDSNYALVMGLSGAADVQVHGFNWSGGNTWAGVFTGSGSKLDLCDGLIAGGTSTYAINVTGADSIYVEKVRSTGCLYGAHSAGVASVWRFGKGVDFSSASGADIHLDGSAKSNVGTLTLNGATGVDVNFPILTTEEVSLSRTTALGTPSGIVTVTKTVGTKFTVTGIALDVSTFRYKVE
jgi:hypothetical protein